MRIYKIFIYIILTIFIISCKTTEKIIHINKKFNNDIDIITVENINIWEMVLIPAGNFTFGSNNAFDDECPSSQIYLEDYYIDKYEVTCLQYSQFCSETGHPIPDYWMNNICHPSKYYEPVRYISYQDAVDYTIWIGKTLPTEKQWEKAAKGVDNRIFSWGNEWEENYCRSLEERYSIPQKIGWYFSVSPYGIKDMTGNVYEWTSSWYRPYQNSNAKSEYFGSIVKVIRGGSFVNSKEILTTTYRGIAYPNIPSSHIGFRCVYIPNNTDSFPETIIFKPENIIW